MPNPEARVAVEIIGLFVLLEKKWAGVNHLSRWLENPEKLRDHEPRLRKVLHDLVENHKIEAGVTDGDC